MSILTKQQEFCPLFENDDMVVNFGNEKYYNFNSLNYIKLCQERDLNKMTIQEKEEIQFDNENKYSYMIGDSDSDENSKKLITEYLETNN
jgi:hypothetical protein